MLIEKTEKEKDSDFYISYSGRNEKSPTRPSSVKRKEGRKGMEFSLYLISESSMGKRSSEG